MSSYRISHDDLVQLLALVCAHGILGERKQEEQSEELLDRANTILRRTGVRDATVLNAEIGVELNRLVPEPAEPELPEDVPTDPYLWESGK